MKQYTFKLDSQHTLYMVVDPKQRHYVHGARLWRGQQSYADLTLQFRDSFYTPPSARGLYLAVHDKSLTGECWSYSMVYYKANTKTWYKRQGKGWRAITRSEIAWGDYHWAGLSNDEAATMGLDKVTP